MNEFDSIFFFPRFFLTLLGYEVSGVIASAGKDTAGYPVGTEVAGTH